jgi:hypothetical protein
LEDADQLVFLVTEREKEKEKREKKIEKTKGKKMKGFFSIFGDLCILIWIGKFADIWIKLWYWSTSFLHLEKEWL